MYHSHHRQVSKQLKNPGLLPPAVTVCGWSKDHIGWKGATEMVFELDTICGAGKNLEELKKCVNENTYRLNETIDVDSVGLAAQTPPFHFKQIDPKLWNSSFTSTVTGMCYTLVNSEPIDKETNFVVTLKENFMIMLHDPSFFLLKSDNFFVPHLTLNNPSGKSYQLKVVTKKRMNRKGKFECKSEQGYSFGRCVEESVATRVGCNGPWLNHPVDSLPMCNSTKDILQYDTLYYQIFLADEHKLRDLTDCQVCFLAELAPRLKSP